MLPPVAPPRALMNAALRPSSVAEISTTLPFSIKRLMASMPAWQRGRFDLRVVERNRAVASDANATRALTARLVSRTETLPLPQRLMPSLFSPVTLIARLPGPVISMFPAAIMPMLSSRVMELLP